MAKWTEKMVAAEKVRPGALLHDARLEDSADWPQVRHIEIATWDSNVVLIDLGLGERYLPRDADVIVLRYAGLGR